MVQLRRLPRKVDAVRVEVDAALAPRGRGALFGVGCWEAEDAGYLAVLSRDGSWAILEDERDGDRLRNLGGGRHGAALQRAGEPNELRLECERSGDRVGLHLSINGHKLGSAADPTGIGPYRALSLFAGSEGGRVDVLFDDVSAQEIRW